MLLFAPDSLCNLFDLDWVWRSVYKHSRCVCELYLKRSLWLMSCVPVRHWVTVHWHSELLAYFTWQFYRQSLNSWLGISQKTRWVWEKFTGGVWWAIQAHVCTRWALKACVELSLDCNSTLSQCVNTHYIRDIRAELSQQVVKHTFANLSVVLSSPL